MFQPKLIVTDLDGTVLKNDKTLSQETIEAFAKCHEAGIPIAIATARYIKGAKPFAEALHADFQLLTDGTLVYEGTNLIYSDAMDLSTTNAILHELIRYNCLSHIAIPTTKGLFRYPEVPVVDNYSYFFPINKPFPYEANKMVVELPDPQIAETIAQTCHCAQFRYHNENRYTFYSHTAGKLGAIRFLVKKLSISLSDVLVFGDDINDIEMIAHCGHGVAMDNALDNVKNAADEVTDSNEHNGVAKILSRYYRFTE